jgi:hypothetical protein
LTSLKSSTLIRRGSATVSVSPVFALRRRDAYGEQREGAVRSDARARPTAARASRAVETGRRPQLARLPEWGYSFGIQP